MKKTILIFFSIILSGLAALPIYNGITRGFSAPSDIRAVKKHYFNIDDFLQNTRYLLAKKYSISLSPNRVTFGKDGFLFLGDQYNYPLSAARGIYPDMGSDIQRTKEAMKAWQYRINQYGVSQFHIMISPNKHSVYNDKLPDWAQAINPTVMDSFFQPPKDDLFIDVRDALKQARSQYSHPLYYKTDTHWNTLGGMHAYLKIGQQLLIKSPTLKWLTLNDLSLQPPVKRSGGDLAYFLGVHYFQDEELHVKIIKPSMLTSIQYEFHTGKTSALNNNPNLVVPPYPLLIETPGALNDLRVLWLRDSTGTALSPYLAATFKHLVHQSYADITNSPQKLEEMIASFQPQLILLTITERSFLKHLSVFPPDTPLLPLTEPPNMPEFITAN